MKPHAIQKLHANRLAISKKPFRARGAKLIRCPLCMLKPDFCLCQYRQTVECNAAVILLMHDNEVLKPSNTGRLIADNIEETYAFIWSRTKPDQMLLNLLQNSEYQPFLVFPGEYAVEQTVISNVEREPNKKPLFILLDGSWREARKIFHKSSYLRDLPILSITPQEISRYKMRSASHDNQLATAEVAAIVLSLANEQKAADQLNLWFDCFKERYIAGKMSRQLPEECSLDKYVALTNQK
ncbi:DTW domain-containing protein [Vibrio sp. SS-MA-C1-2]|uniref:tRNA-uridine aminocarboxypropyltransferase n=1 Tax=Vibrio sp. SS-MA-C1-2 TaxID=2908646 RepID=UPI001F22AFDA|nr:tRNA-uridine aminocarboxypropyltransferase [Vibrio sp. SS-MA-C1-2]UJF18160.1 DTW domain-containing protein [Vibrio sp. SS-MA-C1-2]